MRNLGFILGLLMAIQLSAQSKTIAEFEDKADGYNLFIYQSVIRGVLNKEKNTDFNKLIRDLEYIRVLMTDSLSDQGPALYQSLTQDISGEGFEMIAEFDNKDAKVTLYELEGDDRSQWVAVLRFWGRTGIMEMKGHLDTEYMHALIQLDPGDLDSLIEARF